VAEGKKHQQQRPLEEALQCACQAMTHDNAHHIQEFRTGVQPCSQNEAALTPFAYFFDPCSV